MNNSSNVMRLVILFLVVMFLQLLVLDNMDFISLCNPMLYIVVIMSLPFGTSTMMSMATAIPIGLFVDLASNTPGMHTAACILIAFLRQRFLALIAFRTAYKDDEMPNIYSYGVVWYFKYTILMVTIHHITLFLIEQAGAPTFLPTIIRIFLSIIASVIIIILFQLVMQSSKGER